MTTMIKQASWLIADRCEGFGRPETIARVQQSKWMIDSEE
jgi:hypothetical protein